MDLDAVAARSRKTLDLELRDSWRRQYASPALLSLYSALVPRLRKYAVGRVLDAGCGVMPFRRYLRERVPEYRSLDVQAHVKGVDIVADLGDLSGIAERYDTVLCSEVLEHLPDPEGALAEIRSVMRPGGVLILSVPFLSRLHEEPHDYFRFTTHGLRTLLTRAGFEVKEIVPTGSVFSFLGHQVSTAVVCATSWIPGVRHFVFWVNALACVGPCWLLDRSPWLRRKMPCGYVAVATVSDHIIRVDA